MDEKKLDSITKEILSDFHKAIDKLDEVVESEKRYERRRQAWDVREKIFSKVLIKYNTLVWQLYRELETKKGVKFHE